MRITNIKVENCINPVGIDEKKPFFSWEFCGKENAVFQENYRIKVYENGNTSHKTVWDSGTVFSDKSIDIIYQGEELKPDTKYLISVDACANGKNLKTATSMFSTGVLGGKINGNWVSVTEKDSISPETCVFARKDFRAEDISYATFFIYSFGWYEAYLNGEKLDNRLFTPGLSDFDNLLFYDAYDVTSLIKDGKNAIGLIIGDGFNNNANMYMNRWRGAKRFIASLNLHKKDGSVIHISTDDSWRFTADTPLITNNIYNGELYDATREIPGWNTSEFNDSGWKNVFNAAEKSNADFYCNIGPFVTVQQYIRPKKIYTLKNGRYILDFGQNMSGYVQFSLSKARGERVRIKTAEEISINTEGEISLNTATNREATSTDTYIFNGNGTETHHPLFTYHGFRYIEVTGLDRRPCGDEIVACVVHTDFPSIAYLKTDNDLINRIFSNALWSVKSNSQSYPTDCPVRDERTPCSMDLYVYLNSAMYLFAPSAYYPRFLKNLASKKYKGKVKMTWDGCIIALPWYFYRYYGNTTFIKRYYPIIRKIQEKYLTQYPDLIPEPSFGDWCAPNEQGDYLTSFSSCDETEQHAMYFTCKMMSDMADVIGKKNDAVRYNAIAEKAAQIYVKRFYDKNKHTFSNGKQAPNIYALEDRFLPDEENKLVRDNLVNAIKKNGNHLDVGIYGLRSFIECLSDAGSLDTALECFMNPEYPSFANQISKGATTLWEQWCGHGDMASHNHAMFAGFAGGFFTRLAGIDLSDNGFKSILIKPCVTRYINNLSTRFSTVNGSVEVNYDIKNNIFKLRVKIPMNCTAEIVLPDGTHYKVKNGNFEYECNLGKEKL